MPKDGLQLDLRLDGLPAQVHGCLRDLCKRIVGLLRENLEGITVIGSAVTGDFRPGISDINTLVCIIDLHPGVLLGLADLYRQVSKGHPLAAPMVISQDLIQRTYCEFGVEWLDFQLIHKTILGPDPLIGLSFEKRPVLAQCRSQLKAMLIRLRQGLITCGQDRSGLKAMLVSAHKAVLPVARAILWLVDLERPTQAEQTINQVWEAFGVQMQVLMQIRQWNGRLARPSLAQLHRAFEQLYACIDQLVYLADDLEV